MIKNRSIWQLLLFALIIFSFGAYIYGARIQLTELNTDMESNDQYAYMFFTRSLVESGYTYWGDRNRMPVYPLLQSLFYDETNSDEQFFYQGKLVNLGLSILILIGLGVIFQRFLSAVPAVLLWLIVAFQVFIYKAGFFQVELLFYFLSFCVFILLARLLHTRDWRLAIGAGVLAGLTHLTKASIVPGLALFLVLAAVQWGWQIVTDSDLHQTPNEPNKFAHLKQKLRLNYLLKIALVPLFFLITVSPYIVQSKQMFGRYFYNVNSTFYMWYDSWGDVIQGTRAHGDRVGWPDMPAEEIPSLSKYLQEHTGAEISSRFVNGAYTVYESAINAYGYHRYLFFYLAVALAILILHDKTTYKLFKQYFFETLFGLGYFIGYLLLYSWYAPIASGNRFVLALFVPMLFSVFYVLESLTNQTESNQSETGSRALSYLPYLHYLVGIWLAIDIYFILTVRVATIYGGR